MLRSEARENSAASCGPGSSHRLEQAVTAAVCGVTFRTATGGVGWVSILEPTLVTDALDVPEGWEAFALQFKGKGIRQVNIPAQHFIFNAWVKESQNFVANIKKILGVK